MTETMAALTRNRCRGLGRHPWLCAHSIPASPRQARMSPEYIIKVARTCRCGPSDGSRVDSGSLTRNVSAFGAVAPSSMPSSSPAADRPTATLGSDSLLQASLRISQSMTRSTGPVGSWGSKGPYGPGRVACPTDPGGSAAWVDTCVTWAIPPLADMCGH